MEIESILYDISNLYKKINKPYLLCISGGIDSMVLLHLVMQINVKFIVCHCNFQLRNNDSQLDEDLVKVTCERENIEFISKKFNVKAFQNTGNYSIEMSCRVLRYNWFNKLVKLKNLGCIVTAHHLNDSIETFFLNAIRGTGIKGLKGIDRYNSKTNIFRPLINCTKNDIIYYANKNNIKWREDLSNSDNNFKRNFIRNNIIKKLEEINPNVILSLKKTVEFIRKTDMILENIIINTTNNISNIYKKYIIFNINEILKLNYPEFYLHNIFYKYNFKYSKEIIKLINSKNNSILKSHNYILSKYRDKLILVNKNHINKNINIKIIENKKIFLNNKYIKFVVKNSFDKNATQVLDYNKINNPIYIKNTKFNDYIYSIKFNKITVKEYMKNNYLPYIYISDLLGIFDSNDNLVYIINKVLNNDYKTSKYTKLFLNIYIWEK